MNFISRLEKRHVVWLVKFNSMIEKNVADNRWVMDTGPYYACSRSTTTVKSTWKIEHAKRDPSITMLCSAARATELLGIDGVRPTDVALGGQYFRRRQVPGSSVWGKNMLTHTLRQPFISWREHLQREPCGVNEMNKKLLIKSFPPIHSLSFPDPFHILLRK